MLPPTSLCRLQLHYPIILVYLVLPTVCTAHVLLTILSLQLDVCCEGEETCQQADRDEACGRNGIFKRQNTCGVCLQHCWYKVFIDKVHHNVSSMAVHT